MGFDRLEEGGRKIGSEILGDDRVELALKGRAVFLVRQFGKGKALDPVLRQMRQEIRDLAGLAVSDDKYPHGRIFSSKRDPALDADRDAQAVRF
jgi:hypothetical protein